MAMTLDPAVIDGLKRMFAGNTQGLGQLVQQEATQNNPDFVKAIALQQLKDQEAAVKRQQALSNPEQPTVVAQRENELMQRTAQEVAQQSAMAAQQKARQQQMGMQRMMAGAADPRAAGIGNLPMGAMRMAGGGIVAFEDGGDVTFEKLAKDVDKALLLGASQEDLASLVMRAGYDPAMFGLDAPMMSGGPRPAPEAPQAPAPRQAPPMQAPGIDGLRFAERPEGSTLAAIEALAMPEQDVPMSMSTEEQIAQALAQGPQLSAPQGRSAMAPPSEEALRLPEAGSLTGTPFEQRAQVKDIISARLEELDVPANRIGSERFLPEARRQEFAEADELRRDLGRLQAAGNDPERVLRAVQGAEKRIIGGEAGRMLGEVRDGAPSDIDALLAEFVAPAIGGAGAVAAPAGEAGTMEDIVAAVGGENVLASATPGGGQMRRRGARGTSASAAGTPTTTTAAPSAAPAGNLTAGREFFPQPGEDLPKITMQDVTGASPAAGATTASGQGLGSLRQPPSITAPEFKEPESMALRRTAASDLITKGAAFDPTKAFEAQQKILRGTQKDGTDRFTAARQRAEDIKAAAAVDPRARSMRNFIETLSAAAGASTPGIGLARAGITSVNVARRGEQEEVKRLQDFDNAISKIEAAELGLDESALERAVEQQAIAANQVIAGNELLTSLTDTEQERLTAEARAKLDVELSDRDSYWSGVDAELKAEQNALLRDRNNFDALQSAMEWSTETINTSIANAVDEVRSSPEYQQLMFTAQSGDPNSKKAQEARRDMEDMEIAAEQKAVADLKVLGVYDFQNQVRTLQTKQVTSLASSI